MEVSESCVYWTKRHRRTLKVLLFLIAFLSLSQGQIEATVKELCAAPTETCPGNHLYVGNPPTLLRGWQSGTSSAPRQVPFNLNPNLDPDAIASIQEALDDWNEALEAQGIHVRFVPGTYTAARDGGLLIQQGQTQNDTAASTAHSAPTGKEDKALITLQLQTPSGQDDLRYWDKSRLDEWKLGIKKAMLHEIGHTFGLEDITSDRTKTCGDQQLEGSAMNAQCGPNDRGGAMARTVVGKCDLTMVRTFPVGGGGGEPFVPPSFGPNSGWASPSGCMYWYDCDNDTFPYYADCNDLDPEITTCSVSTEYTWVKALLTMPEEDEGTGPPECSASNCLFADDALYPGWNLESQNGQYVLSYQGDGNLVLYEIGSQWWPIWASDTNGTAVGVALMQGDGNFVVYDNNWTPHWASGTNGSNGAWLILQNDGNLVIYDSGGTPIWSTGIGG